MSDYCRHLLKRKGFSLLLMLIFLFGMMIPAAGCSSKPAARSADGKLHVVVTTTMLYDAVRAIGGEHLETTALMGPGVDPHMYQASAGDVASMQKADIVVYSGLHLEGKMGEIFASLTGQGKQVICAADGIDPSLLLCGSDNPDIYDPHIWFDVNLWKDAARHIAAQLCLYDPANKEAYEKNLAGYLEELDDLDSYIRRRTEELPQEQRVLITAHDAFRYFGKAYGFEVKGLQGISTDAEAGTADVSNLASFIAERKIGAIFVESSVPPKNIEALQAAVRAKGFDVAIGGELYSDSLGSSESGHDTYSATCRSNIDTIVNALK